MTTNRRSRRTWALLQCGALVLTMPALVVLAKTVKAAYDRPVPAVYDTLARFLPANALNLRLEKSSASGIYRFEAQSSAGGLKGEVTTRGTFLWLASPAQANDLPRHLRESLLPGTSREQPRIERVHVMAFEIETMEPSGAELERFVDAQGHLLFEVVNEPETDELDVSENFEDLPAPVAGTILHHVGSRPLTRLQEEVELGSPIHAATWQSGHGEQEVKVLDSGLTLFLELPSDEPVPPEVLRQVPDAADVEALILETYWLLDRDGEVLRAVLSNGTPLFAPERHASQ